MWLILSSAISSGLLGSSLSRALANILVNRHSFRILTLPDGKSYDLVQFGLFVVLSLIIFSILYFLNTRYKYNLYQTTFLCLSQTLFAGITYFYILLTGYSNTQFILLTIIWFFASFILSRYIPKRVPTDFLSNLATANGLFTGFYFLLLFKHFISFSGFSLALFIILPVYFFLFSSKFKLLSHPAFSILLISAIFPFNKTAIIIVGFVTLILILKFHVSYQILNFQKILVPILVLLVFLYNPLFYFGNFDTVEEGFWAGWLQRLLSGQMIYRDFAAHHPPGLAWGLSLFSNLVNPSLHSLRLYFHLLQITGLVIFYYVLSSLIEIKWLRLAFYILILLYTYSFLRNNMEIRIASGLLPLLFAYLYQTSTKKIFAFLSGISIVFAMLISLETGLSSLISSVILWTIYLIHSKNKTPLLAVFAGAALVAIPIFFVLGNSILKMINYLYYYAGNFSAGYQNIVIERPVIGHLLEWFNLRTFITTTGFIWEMSIFALVVSLCIFLALVFKKKLSYKGGFILSLVIFGLILSRSALARSDVYHIIYIWVIALFLAGVLCQYIFRSSKILAVVFICLLFLFTSSKEAQTEYFNFQLKKFQSYANLSGDYPLSKTLRSGLVNNIDENPKNSDDLVSYIQTHTTHSDKIFVFVQQAEIYFLADRQNATIFDNPTVFYSPKYQIQMLTQLKYNQPKLVVYDPDYSISGIGAGDLSLVDTYLKTNYSPVAKFGKNTILGRID